MTGDHPRLLTTVLDAEDVRGLAEFYRELLGLVYRAGDEVPDGPDTADFLVLTEPDGTRRLAFQQVDRLPRATWPESSQVPQQLHLDLVVDDVAALDRQHQRATALGATQLLDRTDDPEEPLRVYADPAGHPFCIFVG
ncbi:VOC family protein [Desertihabitans brevis]|uniref:VOC family protein n=1 Tax=Desertihabitans brevis TaxID=2268447 RepID=A0A367YV85_9ACTN|nr:VOC family protein [Desertihabitans brevis]RCK69720.1 VOC family protein [Desertihabitans brevis]